MPKRKEPPPTPESQVANFEAEVRRLIDAGELNPTEADERLERLTSRITAAPVRKGG